MTFRINPRGEGSTIHRLPETFVNKRGEPILIRTLDERICEGLVQMYLNYQPRNSFQGLPPPNDKSCIAWVHYMIATGISLVGLSFQHGVVGHVVVFPIDDLACELLIAVAPESQNSGIGTRLLRCCVQLAYEIGFEKIWLPVQANNTRARHVYKKCGFEYVEGKDSRELEMTLDVKRYHDAVSIRVDQVMNPNVVTVGLDAQCRQAAELLLSRRISSLPVLDGEQRLVGILSDSDLMLPSNLSKQVADILTRDVLTTAASDTLAKLVRMFQSPGIGSIPVLDEQRRVVGIVGRKDILTYYLRCI
jgi:CBS domain-containing protein/GNAT superfamily N-acetyltransferase